MKEYQVVHTLKRIGDTPFGSVEMYDENGEVVFRLEEKFSNRSAVFASYKLLQRVIYTCRRNKVDVINVNTNDRILANELSTREASGRSALFNETIQWLTGIKLGKIELR